MTDNVYAPSLADALALALLRLRRVPAGHPGAAALVSRPWRVAAGSLDGLGDGVRLPERAQQLPGHAPAALGRRSPAQQLLVVVGRRQLAEEPPGLLLAVGQDAQEQMHAIAVPSSTSSAILHG